MFGQILSGFETIDEFRRLESELLEQLVGRGGGWPAGIRAVRRGTFPPINVGSTADRVDVYRFCRGHRSEGTRYFDSAEPAGDFRPARGTGRPRGQLLPAGTV